MAVSPSSGRRGPMTVLVHLGDQRRSRTDSHGIINFSLGLTRALPARLRQDERLVVLVNDELEGELGRDHLRPQDEVRVIPAPRSIAHRLLVDHHTVLRHAGDAQADVVLYPKGFLPARPHRSPAGHVPCLHDDIPARTWRDRELPLRSRIRPGYFTLLLRHSMRRADLRLFVSAFSAAQLGALAGGTRPSDVVTHEGITLPRRGVRPIEDRDRRVVLLGSPLVHKRTAAGLELVLGDPTIRSVADRVVVTGHLPPGARTGSTLEIDHRGVPLSSDELADLVADSRLLVYPSSYEGFGLPPIEAYALGTPAVFRSTGASREVIPDLPGAFDVEAPAEFAAAVAEALALDEGRLAELSSSMWDRFDWDVVAATVAGALRAEVAGEG